MNIEVEIQKSIKTIHNFINEIVEAKLFELEINHQRRLKSYKEQEHKLEISYGKFIEKGRC